MPKRRILGQGRGRHAGVTSVWITKANHQRIKIEAARRGMSLQCAVDYAVANLVQSWTQEETPALGR